MAELEVIASHNPPCKGVCAAIGMSVLEDPVFPVIKIYKDGTQEVFCPGLNSETGNCEIPTDRERYRRCPYNIY